MNDNRYAPPATPVADVLPTPTQARIQRPRQVVIAVQLAAIKYVLGIIVLGISWDYFSTLQPVGVLIFNQVASLAFFVWLYSKIYAGRNWARITFLVLSVIGTLITLSQAVMTLLKAAPLISKIQMGVGFVTNIVMICLLFLPPGSEWFKKRLGKDP